jgi:hypothetical protein
MSIDLDKVVLAANHCTKKNINVVSDDFLDMLQLSKEETLAVIDLQQSDKKAKAELNDFGRESDDDSIDFLIFFVVRNVGDEPVAVFSTWKEAYGYICDFCDYSITRSVVR